MEELIQETSSDQKEDSDTYISKSKKGIKRFNSKDYTKIHQDYIRF